ncbi:hypothetical protein pdam_00023398 [Pocillopora damicornis]|uniref:DZIP3-like HEPN domain-containing protein n=1 Tax=Pocillopora damicornis TaxID=46731 RepID=A0A3M6U273_POCDA|nr:hypothetical protein pdam_00023398 [Pocillopora damicornis]
MEKTTPGLFPILGPRGRETTNYARLCKLLAAVSAHILRETFEKRRPPGNLDTVLSSPPIHRVLKSLRIKKILNPSQWDKLYPSIKSSVSSKNFDITLLNVLLRTICGLAPPATGWNTLPLAADITLEADIVRIKCYRNTVYGHASEASVDDATFNQYWQDIQDALVRLGGAGYQSAIDDLKNEFMDPDFEEHHKELLKQRVVYEVSIKERLETELLKEAIANPPKKFKAGDKGKFVLTVKSVHGFLIFLEKRRRFKGLSSEGNKQFSNQFISVL